MKEDIVIESSPNGIAFARTNANANVQFFENNSFLQTRVVNRESGELYHKLYPTNQNCSIVVVVIEQKENDRVYQVFYNTDKSWNISQLDEEDSNFFISLFDGPVSAG